MNKLYPHPTLDWHYLHPIYVTKLQRLKLLVKQMATNCYNLEYDMKHATKTTWSNGIVVCDKCGKRCLDNDD